MGNLEYPPLDIQSEKLIKGIRMRIARNIHGYPFANALTKEQRSEIEQKLDGILSKDKFGKYYSFSNMDPETKAKLERDKLMFEKLKLP